MSAEPLAGITSIKVKLGLLVAASVTFAAVVASIGRAAGVPVWLGLPVTIVLALAVTQLLAVGMTSPLRQMTEAARRMATGDYGVEITTPSTDEVGQLARAFTTMARDLASVDRQRRELVANVSHELRTPLTALCAVLENLVDDVAPRDPETLASALGQAERLAGLVEDLLDLARVDAGKAPLTPEPVALAPLLDEAVAEAQVLGRDVRYDVRVAPADLTVHADPARLRQLVANLLDNASRHSPSGGTVLVSVVTTGERYLLEVHDEGLGVAPPDRERAFEPFGTLSGDEGGSTGLGLAIARWVTDLHGGTIGFVDPEPGRRGARVRVSLPLQPADRHSLPTETEESTMPEPGTTPETSGPGPYARVAQVALPPQHPASPPAPRPIFDDLFGSFWPERDVPTSSRLLIGAAGTGLLAALLLPFRELGLAAFIVLLAAGGVVLLASRHRRDPFTLACAALCVLLAATTVIRDAEWVVVLSLFVGGVVCLCGVTRGRSMPDFVLSGLAWPLSGLRGLPWLGRTLTGLVGVTNLGRGPALLRTLVWSALGLLVFGALLGSADALLASWVEDLVPDLTIDTFVLRVFVGVAVGGAVLAAAYLALNPPRVGGGPRPVRTTIHRFEWLAPVLVVNAVLAAFLVAQATVVFGGHAYLRRTTGLTYAEYVHQGFGQLTVVTALTLMVIWAAARKARREDASDRLWLRVSLGLLCLQAMVVVGSALHRLSLYQDAYGLTRMRLLVDVFEGWLGLLLLAVLVAGSSLRAMWFARFALLSGACAIVGLAVVNPDAWIAARNIDRYEESGRMDWTYLQQLSSDAVPAFAELPDRLRSCALVGREVPDGDLLEWNLGRSRAADAMDGRSIGWAEGDELCPPHRP
ncbi:MULTISPECIES: DUF4153 domain-containing protein [unclassified Nocardioides]|uniref:DUF4153 domain-containing protein n=1 Tax=unclassified Nocardioides TaxID=2615069 RepID=UPI0006FAD297|nr:MULTISPECIES: DUF4153 domain-containing protein [unclassified Nocardioides]KRA28115.1 histidine kinase [Nocardioides sp. Root614]KRA86089.1 histidine kinase [Nocardioides sp. Root682]